LAAPPLDPLLFVSGGKFQSPSTCRSPLTCLIGSLSSDNGLAWKSISLCGSSDISLYSHWCVGGSPRLPWIAPLPRIKLAVTCNEWRVREGRYRLEKYKEGYFRSCMSRAIMLRQRVHNDVYPIWAKVLTHHEHINLLISQKIYHPPYISTI
jgi:hypothetical protein